MSSCSDVNDRVRDAIFRMRHWGFALEKLGAGPALVSAVEREVGHLEKVIAEHGGAPPPRPKLELKP